MAPKIQGALENKQPASALGGDLGIEAKSAGNHGGGPTIPEMFKNPQSAVYSLPLAGRLTTATSFKHSLDLVECGDYNGKLVPSVNSNIPSQISADGNGCLDMNESSGDLTLTGLCVSAPSSICEGSLTMSGEGVCRITQGPSSPGITAQAQDFENLRCDVRAAPAHFLISKGSQCLDKTHEATCNNRVGKDGCSGQGDVGEKMFSLSDQSRDSDNSLIDSETYNSFIAPSISTMGRSVIKCQEGLTEEDFSTVNPDKTSEKRKKKKIVSSVRAMPWDYTGTQQLQHNQDDVCEGPGDDVIDGVGEGAPSSLHLIYQTMMAQNKQTQGDNKKACVATKQLQVAVSKIAKTCSEIGESIAIIETQACVLEAELGTVA
ncbi:hypothetical protein NDU88_003390 [Pleurodeles waltl]|uniref:Uncharacterized protein n=1 Tax=Pleurodeles waltl TaxID=8319 RepID=A0AAV7TNH0_PLEWA|nr:hypothetical protein NDU88_003390 [Pleurodeles waltl]